MRKFLLGLAVAAACVTSASAQQVPDPLVDLSVSNPAFTADRGPRLVIDGGHHNFHTVDGRYAPFAQLMRNNGFRVAGMTGPFTDASLRQADILVIANPLHESNDVEGGWKTPNPSAFTPAEITRLRQWVEGGGSLLLIADHMPFAGAAHDLGQAFGIEFENGFALKALPGTPTTPDVFTRENNGLAADPRIGDVTQVRTFTGSAFSANGANVQPILRLSAAYTVYNPEVAWQFGEASTTRTSGEGKLQGALLEVGRGRVAVFGEAAMFTAQVAGPQQTPMGLRAPGAEQNKQFALNVLNWLGRADQQR